MALSGFELDEGQIAICRGILSGDLDIDEEIAKVIEEARVEIKQANQYVRLQSLK